MEWIVRADQWSTESWYYKDGKMYCSFEDRKDPQSVLDEHSVEDFVREYGSNPSHPFPEILAFLDSLG